MFAHCIAVKGASRSIICDIQRGTYDFIPESLYQFGQEVDKKPINEIVNEYSNDEKEIATSYINFLIDSEYAFLTKHPEYYPALNKEYKNTMMIDNAIIDWDADSRYNYQNITSQLQQLNCQNIELRFFDNISFDKLEEILGNFAYGPVRSIEILLKYSANSSFISRVENLITNHARISLICIHTIPEQIISSIDCGPQILLTPESIKDETHCGIVNSSFFSVNQNLFLESLQYNNCLNAKVSIDRKGNIKNCPSMQFSFGSIDEISLEKVVESDDFQKMWKINKDMIDTCKDCEFRYICTDCRAYTTDNNRHYSKPKKCTYNPYKATWEEYTL